MFPSVRDLCVVAQNIENEIRKKRISGFEIISKSSFGIHFNGLGKNILIINLDNQFPYISLFSCSFKKVDINSLFYKKTSKIIMCMFLDSIQICNNDRILVFKLVKNIESHENNFYFLYIELFPYHPNVVLCDKNNLIITELKKTHTDEVYKPPCNIQKLDCDTTIDNMDEYLNKINQANQLLSKDNKLNRIKKAFFVLSKNNKKIETKILKLNNDLIKAINEGNLLHVANELSCHREEYKSATKIVLNNQDYNINQSIDINANIEIFYRRYKKSKIAVVEINKQIQIAKQRIVDNNELLAKLNSMNDDEINYICGEVTNNNSMTKENSKISHYYYEINDGGIKYAFGKNSLQNETVSFLLATRNNYWFHIKNAHGSHLIIRQESRPTDDCLRTACEIVVLLSKKLDGDVTFTKKCNVRKGRSSGQVFIKNYETIKIKRIDDRTRELFTMAVKKSI